MTTMKTCVVRDAVTGERAEIQVPDGWTRREMLGVEILCDDRGVAVEVEIIGKGASRSIWAKRDGYRQQTLEEVRS
jgi:hypothetical protein